MEILMVETAGVEKMSKDFPILSFCVLIALLYISLISSVYRIFLSFRHAFGICALVMHEKNTVMYRNKVNKCNIFTM